MNKMMHDVAKQIAKMIKDNKVLPGVVPKKKVKKK